MIELVFNLTPKEEEVAALVGEAMTVKQIACRLGVSSARVRIVISAIAYKANLDAAKDERVQVALWWHRTHPIAKPHAV